MNKVITTILFCLLIPFLTFAQKNKKKGNTISVSTSFNYYPSIEPYSFFTSFSNRTNDQLILDFITSNSGTFTIEEGETYAVNRNNVNEFPTQILGLGASIRITKESELFHEISLTKLSTVKSSHLINYVYTDSDDEQVYWRNFGYEQRSSVIAFRYELGKYFGKRKRNKFRFGFSGGVEPSFYFYNRKSLSIDDYPIKAKIYTFEVSLSPLFSFQLSKKVFLDLKPTLFTLFGQRNSVEENFPLAGPSGREGEREDYSLPELSGALSLQLRYILKEPSKRGRRR